ncbi:MAG: hypothetical protein RL094_507 [Candidatus Parcubacteria bacterium]|jgi:hypothetical protein
MHVLHGYQNNTGIKYVKLYNVNSDFALSARTWYRIHRPVPRNVVRRRFSKPLGLCLGPEYWVSRTLQKGGEHYQTTYTRALREPSSSVRTERIQGLQPVGFCSIFTQRHRGA